MSWGGVALPTCLRWNVHHILGYTRSRGRIFALCAYLPMVHAPQVAVHCGFVDSGRPEVLQIGNTPLETCNVS